MNTNARAALAVLCLPALLIACKSSGASGGSVDGPATIEIVAGDGQSAPVSTRVPQAPVVVVRGATGGALPGIVVSFEILDGGGSVDASTATTDAGGHASTGWSLGPTPGLNHLRASVAGVAAPVVFAATGMAAVIIPARLEKVSGDGQTAAPGTVVGVAPVVAVLDGKRAPVSGVEVSFAITTGDGSIERGTERTNESGQASCGEWTLGPAKGLQTLTATVAQLSPVMFTAAAANTSPVVQVTAGPPPGTAVGDTVTVHAFVTSTYEIATVTASTDESSVELTRLYIGAHDWGGTVSLAGRTRGPVVLVVTAAILAQFPTDEPVPHRWYDAAGGFVAFVREDAGLVRQIWRYHAGTSEQLSFFGSTSSSIDAIGPDGTVLFTHGQKRYWARPGVALEEVGSPLGRVVYRDGKFLVLLGTAVLEVGP